MKILLSIFLSLQLVTNCTFFEDVARIPLLIEHFQHHAKKESGHLSFFDFIVMHYFSDVNDADIAHNSLPLNHSGDIGHVHLSNAFTLPESVKLSTMIASEIEHVTYIEQFIPNSNLNRIFQPPKA